MLHIITDAYMLQTSRGSEIIINRRRPLSSRMSLHCLVHVQRNALFLFNSVSQQKYVKRY
jgi:hypothetical protein